jgi:hypothetical protein
MGEVKAVELRHDGKTYRAGSREIFFRWAREHRISIDDSYRIAGTEKWIPVTANNELNIILDPENWWKVKMGDKTYVAFDWDSIVKWAKEGRLSVDVQIEGPKTPPGGILGKASPELSPYLREWVPDDPKKKPVRLRFDGRTFVPGNIDTLKKWIQESRVPVEAEVSIQGEVWQTVSDCGYFEKELWPSEESLITENIPDGTDDARPPISSDVSEPPESGAPDPGSTADGSADSGTDPDDGQSEELYRITTTYGEEYSFEDPGEVLSLLKRKRVNSFDEIRHPDFPDGSMFISEYLKEYCPVKRFSILLVILAVLFGAAGAAALVFQKQSAQWMLIGGIASLAVALVLVIRIIWKK